MNHALWSALLAAVPLGIACGLMGTFVVVRRMALTGDMLSHAVLPGVVAGLAWSATRNPLVVTAGAIGAGVLGSWVMTLLLRTTRLKPDAVLALVLSVFFAIGIAMISRLQPAGVHAFLYGQVAAIDRRDLGLLAGVATLAVILVPAGFGILRFVSFDPAFARLLGLPVRAVETVFFLLLTLVIVVAMQAVGVILVTAMLVTPAAAARFFTARLSVTAGLACLFGAAGGAAGILISATRHHLPTGPLMALAVTAIFLTAAVCGPRHGWLPTRLRRARQRTRIAREDFLKALWYAEESGKETAPPPRRQVVRGLTGEGLVEEVRGKTILTAAGRSTASTLVRSHRLWERYLTEHAAYKSDHVHDDAEQAEHWIRREDRTALVEKLGDPAVDPHGSPIPPSHREETP